MPHKGCPMDAQTWHGSALGMFWDAMFLSSCRMSKKGNSCVPPQLSSVAHPIGRNTSVLLLEGSWRNGSILMLFNLGPNGWYT